MNLMNDIYGSYSSYLYDQVFLRLCLLQAGVCIHV